MKAPAGSWAAIREKGMATTSSTRSAPSRREPPAMGGIPVDCDTDPPAKPSEAGPVGVAADDSGRSGVTNGLGGRSVGERSGAPAASALALMAAKDRRRRERGDA